MFSEDIDISSTVNDMVDTENVEYETVQWDIGISSSVYDMVEMVGEEYETGQ